MAQTLQEHYNSIKSGKGNKAQFLRQAREMFPQYFNQYSDFDTATNVLKSKQIISEAAGGVVAKGYSVYDWKKILGEEVKATEKETSKEVADANKNAFQPSDIKNADNVNFNEIMKGFFAEMYDEKNKKKTGDEIKAMVVKNLAKDALYYTKNGNFSTMGIGYTDDAPGLGKNTQPTSKNASTFGGRDEVNSESYIFKNSLVGSTKRNVQDTLGNSEAKDSMPKKVKEMTTTPQNSAGVKKMKMPGAEKKIKLQENNDPNKFELGQEDTTNAPMGVNDKTSSKPMKDKVDIKSTLEKIAAEVFAESDVNKAKNIFKNHIETSGINDVDKNKILKNLESIKNILKLYQYLGNSLLHYEGMGISKLKETHADPHGVAGDEEKEKEAKSVQIKIPNPKIKVNEVTLRSVIRNLINEELNSSTKYEIVDSNANEESLNNIFDTIKLVNSNGLDLKIIDNTGHYAGGYNHINSVYVNSSISFSTLIRKFNDILKSNNIYNIHIQEELNEWSIDINGKIVKTYTQNGDKSFNVTYDDGSKDVIMASNDAWDEINTLYKIQTRI